MQHKNGRKHKDKEEFISFNFNIIVFRKKTSLDVKCRSEFGIRVEKNSSWTLSKSMFKYSNEKKLQHNISTLRLLLSLWFFNSI